MYAYICISANHERIWVIRENAGIMYLFADLVAVNTHYIDETTNYLKFDIGQIMVEDTLCIDSSPICANNEYWDCRPESSNKRYCQKTCDLCNSSISCTFSSDLTGSWSHVRDLSDHMIFNGSKISKNGLETFTCQESHDLSLSTIYTIFDTVEDGCFPNVHCFFTRYVTASMMFYNNARTEAWPDQWYSGSCRADTPVRDEEKEDAGWQLLVPRGTKTTVSSGIISKISYKVNR